MHAASKTLTGNTCQGHLNLGESSKVASELKGQQFAYCVQLGQHLALHQMYKLPESEN